MKIRNDFVSNSSSSSFIVIGGDVKYPQCLERTFDKLTQESIDETILLPSSMVGYTEFGWENERFVAFGERINFTAIQAIYIKDKHPEYAEMFLNVLHDMFGDKYKFALQDRDKMGDFSNSDFSYIDHQSASYEGSNIEMFKSIENMTTFLFGDKSYIQCGNDNEDCEYDD